MVEGKKSCPASMHWRAGSGIRDVSGTQPPRPDQMIQSCEPVDSTSGRLRRDPFAQATGTAALPRLLVGRDRSGRPARATADRRLRRVAEPHADAQEVAEEVR